MAYSPNRTQRLAGKARGLYAGRLAVFTQHSIAVDDPLLPVLAGVRYYLSVRNGFVQSRPTQAPELTCVRERHKTVKGRRNLLLLPSRNGWSDMMPKAYLHAFSIALGYRSAPSKVWNGCASAESRSPSSRKPLSPPNRIITIVWMARTSSLEKLSILI